MASSRHTAPARPRVLRLALAGLVFLVALGVFALLSRSPQGEPPLGGAGMPPGAAGGDLWAPGGATDARIEALQRTVEADGADAETYGLLGDAYLQKARDTGDPSYYARAERAFDAALRRDARSLTATVGAGTLALARHDFRAALELGLRARRLAPRLVRPYAVLADAQIELGRYRAAAETIQRMVDLKPTLASYARASYFRELTGDLGGAVEAMRLAASAGASAPENVAYVQALLGDLELARGRPDAARRAYRTALAGMPGYPPAETGLARVDIARGDLAGASRRLRGVVARLPLTSYLTLLAEVELTLGRRSAAVRYLGLVRAQQRLLRSAGANADAELVLFEADHGDPRAAVRHARVLWRDAPSVRSADALGWALTRAGRPAAGLPWARRALRLGSRDPLLHYHAGMSAKAARRPALARRRLRRALSPASALSPLHVRRARRALGAPR
jgi:tetratricopeptide (TPR) repeat protein